MIKKTIKKILRYIITSHRRHDYILNKLSLILDNVSIYDIGASYRIHDRFEVFFKSKFSNIFTIDPNSHNLEYVNKWNYKSKITKVPYAVGKKTEERILNIARIDSGSSLLDFDFNNNNNHRIVKENLLPIEKKFINVKSFNEVLNETLRKDDYIILKLDTQGTELEILESIDDKVSKNNILCVEVENGIATDPVNPTEKGIVGLLNFFKEIDCEIIDLKVVPYRLPKASNKMRSKNVPKECDWVFMKKFSYVIKQDIEYQILALSCYISYHLYGEAIEIIHNILNNTSLNSEKRKVLESILKVIK